MQQTPYQPIGQISDQRKEHHELTTTPSAIVAHEPQGVTVFDDHYYHADLNDWFRMPFTRIKLRLPVNVNLDDTTDLTVLPDPNSFIRLPILRNKAYLIEDACKAWIEFTREDDGPRFSRIFTPDLWRIEQYDAELTLVKSNSVGNYGHIQRRVRLQYQTQSALRQTNGVTSLSLPRTLLKMPRVTPKTPTKLYALHADSNVMNNCRITNIYSGTRSENMRDTLREDKEYGEFVTRIEKGGTIPFGSEKLDHGVLRSRLRYQETGHPFETAEFIAWQAKFKAVLDQLIADFEEKRLTLDQDELMRHLRDERS